MNTWLEALRGASAADRDTFRPTLFRLADPTQRGALEELLRRSPGITVHDQLLAQLRELVGVMNPSRRFDAADLEQAVIEHLGGQPPELYGTWVHYPWSNRLVHLLDEAEFALVRTDRNRNKITREEQAMLATKRIGIIGLSVGQSAALTLALERGFGELRIADFDTLDLSNLNRIRSGVHHLGIRKTVNVAREIAEIDPYLKVTCFHEGITRDNIDRFLTEGGQLDLLVEECDSVDIKILARQRAKAHRIPVVMDTSDRGLIDVERFDLEPDRPILHGRMEGLDLDAAMRARTSEEKLPFVVPMLGLENLSPRMKASMMEIGSTIGTWPQLASAIAMGGGTTAHVARRILLGEAVASGRWWLDPDDMLNAPVQDSPHATGIISTAGGEGDQAESDQLERWADQAAPGMPALELTLTEAEALAEAGRKAPSGGNCQPWRFLHHQGRMHVFLHEEEARSALDPGLRYAHLAMGACVENMALEAARLGLDLEIKQYPVAGQPDLVASMTLRRRTVPASPIELELAEAISQRCTNRRPSETLVLGPEEHDSLMQAVSDGHTSLHVVTDRGAIEAVALLCGRAERIRFLNPVCHHDMFVKEMRWDRREVERTCDGIDADTLELSLSDRVGLRVAADPHAMSMLRHWGAGRAIEKLTAKSVRASSALAILSVPGLETENAFRCGRAMQRFWLAATRLGLLTHPVGAPIFMDLIGRWDKGTILNSQEREDAAAILKEFRTAVGAGDATPFFMLRLGRAAEPTARSLRRPLGALLRTTLTEQSWSQATL